MFNLALKHPQLQKHLLPIRRMDYLTWYIDNYLNHDEDYRDAIAQLACPTTFFIGEKSSLYPAEGQMQVSNSLINAKNIIFKRSGHTTAVPQISQEEPQLRFFLL
ncbi:MAG: hypothetical protein GAK29_01374 [Acinetobacter bereziniae]|uniref:Uncharacterized protein n=1 Tax=Acinetobacter bereziniae TaxID=106648 RepID=A0A833PIH3_ACIBZ|nr:MAG: hypothetical protein GAK29_01374 [Acinetobacter bereziniae]